MPGFIGNYKLASINQTKRFNTLGCKLVTAFPNNSQLQPPKPNILANIFLMNELTGELKAIIQGSEITAWRTAAASIVATKFLYSSRPSSPKIDSLAILGCGVQVRDKLIIFHIAICIFSLLLSDFRVEYMLSVLVQRIRLVPFDCGIDQKIVLKH